MILIACCDDKFGISFNNRRTSSDVKVTEKILDITNNKLNIFEYSSSLFPTANVVSRAEDIKGEYLFKEIEISNELLNKAEKIIIFRWNRVYPADKYIDLKEYKLSKQEEFIGNSHELITMEEYIK